MDVLGEFLLPRTSGHTDLANRTDKASIDLDYRSLLPHPPPCLPGSLNSLKFLVGLEFSANSAATRGKKYIPDHDQAFDENEKGLFRRKEMNHIF